jgi:hypothetical protein
MHVGKHCSPKSWSSCRGPAFARIVHRYSGNAGARTLSCAEQFRAMAFAQLTWREPARHRGEPVGQCDQALRDGLSLCGQALQLADANELRDWRIWADLAPC